MKGGKAPSCLAIQIFRLRYDPTKKEKKVRKGNDKQGKEWKEKYGRVKPNSKTRWGGEGVRGRGGKGGKGLEGGGEAG